MNLADHLRPLLRDHDCVIIPDFGALVAETAPARVQLGTRHQLSPPSRRVAFNQALTRNDGLLVDALAQYLGLSAAAAREALRQAVAALTHELQARQRTELPGIGVFRQLAGRGLQFEYTGTENLLPAAFGLPELTAHPVRATDARLAREQQAQLAPRLRSASRGWQLRRVVPGAAIGLLAGLAVAGLYLLNLHPETLPAAWQGYLPRWEQATQQVATQQAALAQPSFTAPVAAAPQPAPAALTPEPTAASTWDTDPEPTPPQAAQVAPVQAAPKQAAPAKLVKAAPAHVTPAAVVSAPADPTPVATAHPAPHPADPVDALLAQPNALPSPIVARPRGKRRLPAAAAIAVANASNIARPVPMAQRTAATPALATSYAALHAAPAVPKPAPAPEAAAAPVTTKVDAAPVVHLVAAKPAAHPAAPVAKAAPAPKPAAPVAKVAAAAPAKAPVAKSIAPSATTAATINARTGRYYVVVGAYNSLAHAQQGLRNLLLAGHAGAKIIVPYPGTRFFRLSAADYADRPMAQLAAAALRKTPHADQGLTVFPY